MSRHTLYTLAALLIAAVAQPVSVRAADEDINDLQEKALKAAVAKIAPCVVQIETSGGTEIISAGPRGMQVRKGVGPTTGLIVAGDGYVISSAFNFANKPTAIFVTVPGQKERFVAKSIATDQTRMLTLLKIEANGLPVPAFVPKKDIKVGAWAMALGRTLDRPEDRELNQPPSVSVGIISAINRIWGKAVQTDAKVSPANYGGPLVDVAGRVIAVLVPASPRQDGETAGLEWYDSGIGFGIPLEDINTVLPKLREGKDLRRGLLGITMKGTDEYGVKPTVDTIAPESAAQKAGIKSGDVIVEIDGAAVTNRAQLMHKLGAKYEGDSVNLVVKRGEETVKVENIKLAGTLTTFPHPFLGILPLRDDPDAGEEIRYVYPDSPAAKAGLKVGDRIMKIGVGAQMQAFKGRDALTNLLNTIPPGTDVKLEVTRKADKKTETVTVKLGTLPDTVPGNLPELSTLKKAHAGPMGEPAKKEEKKPETGVLKRTNAARDHDYWINVPENYETNVAHALVLWLHPVGKGKEKDIEDFVSAWKDICEDHHIIVLAPKAENETGWLSSESDVVTAMVREVMAQYTIDKQRVIVHGMGIGGQMAFYMGFNQRDLIRGVATTGAVVANQVKDNVANQRLSFFVIAGGKDPLVKDIQESKSKLSANKFSVVYREIPEMGHQYLDAKTLGELVRWIDSLDRQ